MFERLDMLSNGHIDRLNYSNPRCACKLRSHYIQTL